MLIPTKPPGSSTLLGHPGPPFTGTYLTSSVSLSGLSEPNPIYLDTRCGHFFPGVSTTCLLRVLPGERGTAPLNLRCPKPVVGLRCTPHPARLSWSGGAATLTLTHSLLSLSSPLSGGILGVGREGIMCLLDSISQRFQLGTQALSFLF